MHHVSETELKLLRVLWDGGEQTVRQIAEVLYASTSGNIDAAAIGTVHSLLGRLEGKKLVRRSRRTHPHRFSAKVSIDDVIGDELEEIARQVGEGSIAPFLMHLISHGKLTQTEADEIRALLAAYKPGQE